MKYNGVNQEHFKELFKRINSSSFKTLQPNLRPFDNKNLDKQNVYFFDGNIYIHYIKWEKLVLYYLGSTEQALDIIFEYNKQRIHNHINKFILEYNLFINNMSILRKTHCLPIDFTNKEIEKIFKNELWNN